MGVAACRRRKPKTRTGKFKEYPIGYFHLDTSEVRTKKDKLHLFADIDRASKFAFARLHGRAAGLNAGDFPEMGARSGKQNRFAVTSAKITGSELDSLQKYMYNDDYELS